MPTSVLPTLAQCPTPPLVRLSIGSPDAHEEPPLCHPPLGAACARTNQMVLALTENYLEGQGAGSEGSCIPEKRPLPSVGKVDGDGHPADQGDPSPEVY